MSFCEFAYPVTSGLCDVFSDLFGRQTERSNLGSERRRSTNFTTGRAEVDDFLLIWVDLGC